MTSRLISGTLGALVLAGALWIGTQPVGTVPPLARLLDPARGAWALAARAQHPRSAAAEIPGLSGGVDIRYDDRGVPHIFATNELDALRALGYAVARDRLFQLELQTRATNGTLTELVGDRALDVDRDARQIGMPWGARRKFLAVSAETPARRAMQAYADGVNAYIDGMSAADLPIEYRLLNRTPQRWEPEHSMLLLVRMGYTLAFSDLELARPDIEARIGREATDALFPVNAYVQEPIQPNGQRTARVDGRTFPAPRADTATAAFARTLAALPRLRGASREVQQASNNWAVAPKRSANGHALLANDPHLDLTLPSTWYEAHLVVRDSIDVYGVTFPGAPSIVLGLNRDVAWGATNVGADVTDYYLETVDDSVAPKRYKLDDGWKPLTQSIERYLDPRGTAIATDTLYYTHRGVMNRVGRQWISARWLVLEPSDDFDVFRAAPRAKSVQDFFTIMGAFVSPAQNFVVADRGGHIGIRSTGRYPLRPGDGRGDRLFDGSTSKSDWTGWIAPEGAPQVIDPPQGFIASANQQPADPRAFKPYLGSNWWPPWRAMRINTLLRADSSMTAARMREMHTDPGSARADLFMPLILAAAQSEARAGRGDAQLTRAAKLLGDWDRRYTLDNERAVLFEATMTDISRQTWDELDAKNASGDALPLPGEQTLYALMQDAASIWWDRAATPAREARDAVIAGAIRSALERVERERGPLADGKWKWSRVRFANIWHPLRFEVLSALNLPMQAGRETINPSSGQGTHSASWRLVTDMGPEIRAWGIYPGGQSANPVSPHYRDRVETWRRGDLDSLRIPATPSALSAAHTAAALTLSPRR